MKILSARAPAYADAAGSGINLIVKTDAFGEVPFTASADDIEPHSRELHAMAVAGEFGLIAAYVATPPSPQVVADEVRSRLREIDARSIRAIREYIAAQAGAPSWLRELDAAAQAERAKLGAA